MAMDVDERLLCYPEQSHCSRPVVGRQIANQRASEDRQEILDGAEQSGLAERNRELPLDSLKSHCTPSKRLGR